MNMARSPRRGGSSLPYSSYSRENCPSSTRSNSVLSEGGAAVTQFYIPRDPTAEGFDRFNTDTLGPSLNLKRSQISKIKAKVMYKLRFQDTRASA